MNTNNIDMITIVKNSDDTYKIIGITNGLVGRVEIPRALINLNITLLTDTDNHMCTMSFE